MINLDNLTEIKQLDTGNYLGSVEGLPDQIDQAWAEVKTLAIPSEYQAINNIVLNGMGGSALGGQVVKSVFVNELKVPFEIINSYSPPAYVDGKTLFIFASYSGTTEEILASVEEVLPRGAKCLGLATGGRLLELLRENQIPVYQLKPLSNPSGQPRAGIGYSVMGLLAILAKIGLISVQDSDISELKAVLRKVTDQFSPEVPEETNPAKRLARELKGKSPILIGAQFVEGSLHTVRNLVNETAKNFAGYFSLSELNHHLLDGLAYPKNNPEVLKFLFITSKLYHPRIQKRLLITQDVIRQNQIQFLEYNCQGKNKLTQALEVLVLGSYISFYLALLNEVDPGPVQWVDYLKEKLA